MRQESNKSLIWKWKTSRQTKCFHGMLQSRNRWIFLAWFTKTQGIGMGRRTELQRMHQQTWRRWLTRFTTHADIEMKMGCDEKEQTTIKTCGSDSEWTDAEMRWIWARDTQKIDQQQQIPKHTHRDNREATHTEKKIYTERTEEWTRRHGGETRDKRSRQGADDDHTGINRWAWRLN